MDEWLEFASMDEYLGLSDVKSSHTSRHMLCPSKWRTRVTFSKAVAQIPKIEDEDSKEKQDSETVEMLH
jgi:hypothetical protein